METALALLKSEFDNVCITLDPHYELGGLANTIGIVNTVFDFGLQHKLKWLWPDIQPPAHATGDSFRYMFGKPGWCQPRRIPLYVATCPFQLSAKVSELPVGHCNINDTWVHPNTFYSFTRCQMNCSSVLMVSSIIDWIFDFSRTGEHFANKFWARKRALGHRVPSEMEFPLSTAVHLRLGDVKGTGDPKEFNAAKFEALAEGLTSTIDPACLKVELHTDAVESDDAVQHAKSSWESRGVAGVTIFDVTTEETVAFDRLVAASILIGGPSGFSRLAAVLGKASVKLFINDYHNTHPIEHLNGTTTVGVIEEVPAVTLGLAANQNMKTLTEACKAWLAERERQA